VSAGAAQTIAGSGEGVRTLTASDIAALVGGTLLGDAEARVSGVAALDRAGSADLSFLASGKYADEMRATGAGIVLVAPDLTAVDAPAGTTRIVVAKPHDAMLECLPRLFSRADRRPGVDSTARIGRGVTLGADVAVGPYAVIEDGARLGDRVDVGAHVVIGAGATVGDDSRLYDHVTLYPHAAIGRRVTIHSGARLACDGFGYVFRDGRHEKIPHVGRCLIEDDVEIGANTTIDRGSIDDTIIGAGTKIDNLVHIGHNVRIGKLCLVMAQVGVAGSARVGNGVIIAGQAGLAGHITIGDGARVGAQAGVFGDVPARESWSGYPARPHTLSLRSHAALFKLSGMIKELERLLAERRGPKP
jgi:UDP-3-O-[3-hydroxymyristoyl] glucosamine N-acyltransferase